MAQQKKKTRPWLKWAVQLLIVAVIILGVQHWRTRTAASGPAPLLSATTIDGQPFALTTAQLPAVVHFWATWCPVCRFGQGTIDALARDHAVISVALASGTDDEIAEYMKAEGLRFPVINDLDGQISARWGVVGVPTSFVIDTAGDIRFVTSGITSGPGLRVRLWFADGR